MHNLAVLYAEGIDGKPDYQTAAAWFRKAADYGIADSQYNLAILYARGIGVEQNLAEAYKWFALAARDRRRGSGQEARRYGRRLDQQSLAGRYAGGASLETAAAAGRRGAGQDAAGGWERRTGPSPAAPPSASRAAARTQARPCDPAFLHNKK